MNCSRHFAAALTNAGSIVQRFGTDAASQFAVSSHLLDEFNRQVGFDWTDKNIGVVLRVVNGKVGAPIIEATHIW